MTKMVFEGSLSVDWEDYDMAVIADVRCDPTDDPSMTMFVRLQSWDLDKKHEDIEKFIGKRIRVIVETVDD